MGCEVFDEMSPRFFLQTVTIVNTPDTAFALGAAKLSLLVQRDLNWILCFESTLSGLKTILFP